MTKVIIIDKLSCSLNVRARVTGIVISKTTTRLSIMMTMIAEVAKVAIVRIQVVVTALAIVKL